MSEPNAPVSLFTAVDLFVGAGGFSLGLHRAGFDVVLANEFSVDPEWTYRENFLGGLPREAFRHSEARGATPAARAARRKEAREWISERRREARDDFAATMHGGDVSEVLSDEWLERWLRERGGAPDLVVGGPPCQGFSTAGKGRRDDSRNRLVHEAVRVILKLQPKVALIENVPGMLTRHQDLLADVGRALSGDYVVQAELLHSERYGVPQTRKRLILVGVRKDLVTPAAHSRLGKNIFPPYCPAGSDALGAPTSFGESVGAGAALTARRVLGDLSAAPPAYATSAGWCGYRRAGRLSSFQRELRMSRELYLGGTSARDVHSRRTAGYANHEASVHTERVVGRMQALREAALSSPESRCSTPWLRRHLPPEFATKKTAQRVLLADHWPALTVTSLPDDIVHYREDRIPTVREMGRLQTFPDWFEFYGVRTTGFERRVAGIFVPHYTQVANAVPPRLAHAIAARLRQFLHLVREAPNCDWQEAELDGGFMDTSVNPEGGAAARALGSLNEYFLNLANHHSASAAVA